MTSDESTTVKELKDYIQSFIKKRDWEKYHTVKDLAISISIEASELLELFQWLQNSEINYQLKESNLKDKIKEELSDVVIYSLSLSNVLGLNLSEAIIEKIKHNSIKYPVEKIRGKYRKYTEISD